MQKSVIFLREALFCRGIFAAESFKLIKKYKKTTCIIAFLLSLSVFAQVDQVVVSPGSVFTNEACPLFVDWGYTGMATIYTPTDINHSGGDIVEVLLVAQGTIPDSIPIKLYMMSIRINTWIGDWTWTGVSEHPLMQCVFDGKLAFIKGFCRIRLDNPIEYVSGDYLNVAWEINQEGTGVTTSSLFYNKDVTIASRRTLTWSSNTTPPTGSVVGIVEDQIPVISLRINNPNADPVVSVSSFARCGNDSHKWTNNAANDSVIIVAAYSDEIPYMLNDYNFTLGEPIDALHDLDTVIFKGKSSEFEYDHQFTDLKYRKYYFWNFTTARKYLRSKNSATWGVSDGLLSEDFSTSAELPDGWSNTGDFIIMPSHLATGNGASINLSSSEMFGMPSSSGFCGADNECVIRFKYRYVNKAGYLTTATPASSIGTFSVSINNGTTNNLQTINSSNHTESTSFTTVELPIGTYVNGQPLKVVFGAIWGSGDYYLDIDDVEVYTPASVEEVLQNFFTLYPNPAQESITLQMNTAMNDGLINIINESGQTVKSVNSEGTLLQTIDISDLPSGLCILRIDSADAFETSRFIRL